MIREKTNNVLTVIATLEYRTHIPYGWIATEFCHLNVMGVNDKDTKCIEDAWHDIEFEKCRVVRTQIEVLEAQKRELENEVKDLRDKYKQSKKWYRFANKQEKQLLNDAYEKSDKIYKINDEIKKLNDDRFYSSTELYKKACNLLISKGFVLVSKSSAGNECITHTEIWHKTVN